MYKIQTYEMRREEVPECWLSVEAISPNITAADIISHAIDELLEDEFEFEDEVIE